MPPKSLNDNLSVLSDKTKKTKIIQKFIKQNSSNFKQEDHDVQLVLEIKTLEDDEVQKREYNTDVFKIFGGKYKLRKGIEHKITEIEGMFKENYNKELLGIIIKRIYIDYVKRDVKEFGDIKMFGTLLNLCGYELNVGNYEFLNACCVEYHVKMFNKFRDNKWNIHRFIKEIGMASVDEGVCLNQLIPLYIKYKIGYHVVDFKYHVTASHKSHNYTPTRNYPSLFYMIEGNHLYPIVNKTHQKSIAQINDICAKKIFKPKETKPTKRTVNIFHRPDDILEMLKHEDVQSKDDIFVCTTPTVVHDLFYTLLQSNKLFNKNVRTDNSRIIQFDIGNLTIQENTDYRAVESTIKKLNSNTTEEYIYHGQSIHRLAHEYYERNHDKNYQSQLSPQVAHVFNDKLSKNTAFNITLKETQATHAYDFNKLYASILRCCGDDFGWCQYIPTDYIEPFDGKITTGFYHVITTHSFPFRGNGWYADIFVAEALQLNLIIHDDIKYQIKASNKLSECFFNTFVDAIVKSFDSYKQANNGFIGILAKNYNTYEKHYFTQDRMSALKEWLKNPSDVSYTGIYDNHEDLHKYQFMMMDQEELQTMIDIAKNKSKQVNPMVWMVRTSKKTPLYNNSLPIHRKIYDIANMKLYKQHLYITSLNPRAELVRIKVDLVGYTGIDNEIETDDYTWGKVKREWQPPKPGSICDQSKIIRTMEYQDKSKQWYNHKREIIDDSDIQSILKKGGLIHGGAGTGKSTTLNRIKEVLQINELIVGAFTHKASGIVGGCTLHRLFGIDTKTKKFDYKLIKSYHKAGVKYIFIDEISMIPSWLWNIIAHIKEQYEFIIIGCGDWKQLPPVDEEDIDFENSWIVKYIFNNNSYELVKVWRFSESQLLQDAYSASKGDSINFSGYKEVEHPLALCHTNDAVDAINKKWNEHYAGKQTTKKEVKGFDNTTFIMYVGMKLMAYKTHSAYTFTNSQELTVKSWNKDTMSLITMKNDTINVNISYTTSFKPRFAMTVHKSQGSTFIENYSIYEYEAMSPRMLYVALTRARNKEQVNFCKIEHYQPYTGYIYTYEYQGRYYVGSTTNLTKRKQEHKNGTKAGETKFKKAICEYGFDNFSYKVIETIKFGNIKELWKLEDTYIVKYNSIENGFNYRMNCHKDKL